MTTSPARAAPPPRDGRRRAPAPRRGTPWLAAAVLAVATIAGGCGKSGPPRYGLTGSISYEGRPVESGWIVFVPDHGPAASAVIRMGRFTTRPDWGTIGGPHRLDITALELDDANNPTQLFHHELRRELPRHASTLDITLTHRDVTP